MYVNSVHRSRRIHMRKDLSKNFGPKEAAMTTQDHYSLRWNNHQNHILRAFDTLLQTKTLVDVTLVCAETSIRAHKMVLSACSPFFQRVFSETPCKHPVIVLKDFRGWVVQAIVDFMYRGEISVPQERLQTLIQAGESLQVRGLVENTVPANTPTPAASPDDFSLMDASMLQSDLADRMSNYDDEPAPTMIGSNSKLILPSQIFGDSGQSVQHSMSNPDLCTSPMPRRKQARPRRRSGECGPHDLSKPSSPIPDTNEVVKVEPAKEDKPKVDDSDSVLPIASSEDEESPETPHKRDRVQSENCDGPEDLCTKKDNASTTSPLSKKNQQHQPQEHQSESIQTEEQNLSSSNNTNANSSNSCSNNNNNSNNNVSSSCSGNSNMNNNNRIILSLKEFRHLNKPPTIDRSANPFHPAHPLHMRGTDSHSMKSESMEGPMDNDGPFHLDQMDLSMAAAAAAAAQHHHQQQMVASGMLGMHSSGNHQNQGHDRMDSDMVNHRLGKDFTSSSPMNLPSHFNPPDGPPHPPSPLPFPGMSSALGLTPPHMFGLDSPLGLFPPGMDPGKLYNPLMEMSDPRGLSGDHPPFLKKKMSRPKGQHSAPRGGPPRSWTNAELTEALQHVWNKKMTTSQASRIFGIPYNSLLMYVRGKYGKSLKLEQLRKDCISGPPLELLTMSMAGNNNNSNKNMNENRTKDSKDLDGPMQRSSSSEPDLMSSPNPLFNPFPPGFYPDFHGGFPGLPLGMLNLLPPERHPNAMHMNAIDEDCKSDRSKQSLEDDFPQPLALNREDRREMLQQNGQD